MRVLLTEVPVTELFGSDLTAECCIRRFVEVFPSEVKEKPNGTKITKIALPEALIVRQFPDGKIEYLVEDDELTSDFNDFAEEYGI